jgi:hypothetical protein
VKQRFSILLFIIASPSTWPVSSSSIAGLSTLYYGDPNGYYLHVVSFFVNQDVGDYDQTITSLQRY